MLSAGDRVLVAVSGGPDSMALLESLSECGALCRIRIEVAHFNHRLRGAESDRDQRLVEERCQDLGVTCHVGHSTRTRSAGNLEERARAERYRFLLRTAKERRCDRVATGHTRDDQAETVLMRLIRGSGVDGLAGIRAVRDDGVIRPLIDRDRREVLAYLGERGVAYADDLTNRDCRLLRNRVRHEILPAIGALNPNLGRTLARTAEAAAADAEILGRIASQVLRECTGDDQTIELASLDGLPEGLRVRVLRSWLKDRRGSLRGVGAAHLRALSRLARGDDHSRRVQLPGDGLVVRERRRLRFQRGITEPDVGYRQEVVDGANFDLSIGWRVTAALRRGPGALPSTERSLWYFWADANAVGSGLTLRSAARGDRIEPLGLRGHRKLQDVFTDAKVPRSQRWTRPLLEADGRVLWVPGLVRSQHALISPQTRVAWRVAIEASPVAGE